ncbi:hypothetical protein PMIN01_00802 [Paraphaeosphaeria minitans]|uniref:Uncharacterized protein n=1 Tax=Paraphaeosphaeria minitans TaxID=565426 RepID=A0A9P6KVS5_9PLEO|nr:hypothetical protein PMIN01_00802 [Paraphaeosphaeria minitans]
MYQTRPSRSSWHRVCPSYASYKTTLSEANNNFTSMCAPSPSHSLSPTAQRIPIPTIRSPTRSNSRTGPKRFPAVDSQPALFTHLPRSSCWVELASQQAAGTHTVRAGQSLLVPHLGYKAVSSHKPTATLLKHTPRPSDVSAHPQFTWLSLSPQLTVVLHCPLHGSRVHTPLSQYALVTPGFWSWSLHFVPHAPQLFTSSSAFVQFPAGTQPVSRCNLKEKHAYRCIDFVKAVHMLHLDWRLLTSSCWTTVR